MTSVGNRSKPGQRQWGWQGRVLCLKDEVKWSKSGDLLDRAGEIGEKEGSEVVPVLQLRLRGLFKKIINPICPFPQTAFAPLILYRHLKIPEKMNV